MPGAALAALEGLRVNAWCRATLACGPYQVGPGDGLLAEYLIRPPRFTPRFRELSVDVEGLEGHAVLNPFSWRTLSPQLSDADEGTAGCVRLRSSVALPPGIEAGEAREVQGCLDYTRGVGTHKPLALGAFKIRLPGAPRVARLGLQRVAVARRVEAAAGGNALSLKLEDRASIEIKINTVNFRVKLLYVNRFEEPEASPLEPVEGNALSIQTPLGGLAIASREPVEARVKPGSITLEAEGSLKLSVGGVQDAFRLLAELLYNWKPLNVEPGKRLPGYWSVASAAALTRLSPREAVIKIVNPTSKPGVLSLQPPFRPRAAWLETPLGGEELVASHELRVPAPPCFCGVLSIRGGIFERLARRARTKS